MAGELLIRVVDYEKFVALTAPGRSPAEAARIAFLDQDQWSLVDRIGVGWVVIDGPAFFEAVPALYEGHHEMPRLLEGEETSTLIVPDRVLATWRQLLGQVPAGKLLGIDARTSEGLVRSIDLVLSDSRLRLTIESLL